MIFQRRAADRGSFKYFCSELNNQSLAYRTLARQAIILVKVYVTKQPA